MKTTFLLIFLLCTSADSKNQSRHHHDDCKIRVLSDNVPPARLNYNATKLIEEIGDDLLKNPHNVMNFSLTSRKLLSIRTDVTGVILRRTNEALLALNINSRLRIFPNKTAETGVFWTAFDSTTDAWGKPFKDCNYFTYNWFYVYARQVSDLKIGLFIRLNLDQCEESLKEIFGGGHRCGETLKCVNDQGGKEDERRGLYRCVCLHGFFYPGADSPWTGISGEDLESGKINNTRCEPCPINCPKGCSITGNCIAQEDAYLKTCIVVVQLVSMGIVFILALVVFKQRKTKAIATGMWTILEIILLGFLFLYSTVIIRSLEPSINRCLLEPWIREIGFIICYGSIVLKLYRHLIEFRTRKAHRWVVKDTDLLKYLLIMILSGLAYMAAFTALTLNFVSENYSLIFVGTTFSGEQYKGCKYLWWDYVTEVGEMAILMFGIHLAYASRNARTQFHERNYLCAASSLELAVCIIFYLARILIFNKLHPDIVLIIYCVRSQLSQTVVLLLIFLPKFWYQQKQVRTLAQEYSCRYPMDAFKDAPSQRSCASGNNSDVEISEISIADMNPDDIRAELKRLYLQLEMFKSKTICRDNPHISKRRGGRKAQHRKFSLQKKGSKEKSLHQSKQREKDKKREMDTEITEAEISRTPEDSICSTEGPSAIYSELPATNQI